MEYNLCQLKRDIHTLTFRGSWVVVGQNYANYNFHTVVIEHLCIIFPIYVLHYYLEAFDALCIIVILIVISIVWFKLK